MKIRSHYRNMESIGEGRLRAISADRNFKREFIYLLVGIGIGVVLVLTRSAAAVVPINPPILISESTSTRGIALESVTFTLEPFSLRSRFPGTPDQRTRVMVFAMNLALQSGEDLSVVSGDAEDGAHKHYPLTIESIRPVPYCDPMSAVVFRLNDELSDVGDVLVSVSYGGAMSNRVRIGIGHVGGGPADDLGALPTPANVACPRRFTVSGRIQLGPNPATGLVVPISGSQTATVTTDADGNYSIDLPAGGNYTINPVLRNYDFAPASQFVTDLTSDQINRSFIATRQTFTIGGRLLDQEGNGLGGLTVNLTSAVNLIGPEQRTTVTDNAGHYQFTDLFAGFDYTVTPPSTAAYTFTAQSVSDLISNQTRNFAGLRRLALNGSVRDASGNGISGIKVSLAGSESAITFTAANGSYLLTATATGNYTITPSLPQGYYIFAPANRQFNNLAGPQTTNFSATFAPLPNSSSVLEFDGQPKTVDYGNFWQEGVNLGHFFWEFWAAPGSNAAATYMLSDGYGGAHALLFGVGSFNSSEPSRYELLGNIFDGVRHDNYFGSDQGPAVGEWGHFAVGWDGQNIITYFNGVPVGKTPFHGPRRTPGPGGGAGRLLIGGSDHSNFDGRIAQVRGYEDANPREALPGGAEASFAPQTVFGVEGNLLSYYFRSDGVTVADLSRGYNGVNRVGWVRGTVAGILLDCGSCPRPQFVVDPSAPNFAANTPAPPVIVPSAPAAPSGALVFDSFSRANSTYLFGSRGGLGSTEGGSAGTQVWQSNQSPTSAQPFGILNSIAVLLANDTALAWVQTGSASGKLDVRVDRRRGRWGRGIHTGLSFRVVNANNFFFAFTSDAAGPPSTQALKVGYYLDGQRVDLATSAALPDTWTTLRVVTTDAGDLKVYADNTLLFSTNTPLMATAIGAGLYNNSFGLGLVNRWENFTVFNAP